MWTTRGAPARVSSVFDMTRRGTESEPEPADVEAVVVTERTVAALRQLLTLDPAVARAVRDRTPPRRRPRPQRGPSADYR